MDRDRLPHLIVKYQPRGKRSQKRPLKNFSTDNGIGTGHEDQNPASYMIMTIMITIIMDAFAEFMIYGCR
jgi:hypothetical protein